MFRPIFSEKATSNITKFYLFNVAWMFVLIFTINIVFFQENGISISQITVLDVLWAATAFFFKVPIGALADRWSRKYMLVFSGVSAAAGLLLYSVSSVFWPFALATIFMGLRETFSYGTANALLYDSLKSVNLQGDFEKILGRSKFFGTLSASLAGVLGAYLASFNLRLPFIISIFTSLLAATIALTFKEPKIYTSTGEVKYFEHIKEAVKYVLAHPVIRFLLIYLIFMDVAISHLDEYDQLYLTTIHFPLAYFGVWIALRRGLGGIGGLFAEKFKKKPANFVKTAAILAMITTLFVISQASKYLALTAFLLIFPLWGALEVLVLGELHSRFPSHQRATIESLMVFSGVAIDTPIRLSFGHVCDSFGIRLGYLFIGGVLLVYLPYFLTKRKVLLSK